MAMASEKRWLMHDIHLIPKVDILVLNTHMEVQIQTSFTKNEMVHTNKEYKDGPYVTFFM